MRLESATHPVSRWSGRPDAAPRQRGEGCSVHNEASSGVALSVSRSEPEGRLAGVVDSFGGRADEGRNAKLTPRSVTRRTRIDTRALLLFLLPCGAVQGCTGWHVGGTMELETQAQVQRNPKVPVSTSNALFVVGLRGALLTPRSTCRRGQKRHASFYRSFYRAAQYRGVRIGTTGVD